ncbi:hypothetical protein Tco_1067540, partial [Tanacetum coccineum]
MKEKRTAGTWSTRVANDALARKERGKLGPK